MNLPALYTLFTSALLSPKVVFSQQSTILFPSLCSVEHKHVFIFIIFHNKMFFVVFFFYYYFYAFFNLHVNQLLEGGKTHMCSRPVVTFMKTQKGKRLKKKHPTSTKLLGSRENIYKELQPYEAKKLSLYPFYQNYRVGATYLK